MPLWEYLSPALNQMWFVLNAMIQCRCRRKKSGRSNPKCLRTNIDRLTVLIQHLHIYRWFRLKMFGFHEWRNKFEYDWRKLLFIKLDTFYKENWRIGFLMWFTFFFAATKQNSRHKEHHQEEYRQISDAIDKRNKNIERVDRITAWKRCQTVWLQGDTDIRVACHGGMY